MSWKKFYQFDISNYQFGRVIYQFGEFPETLIDNDYQFGINSGIFPKLSKNYLIVATNFSGTHPISNTKD